VSNEIIQFLRGQIPGYHRGWGGPEYTGWQDQQMFWKQTCYVLSKGAYDAQWRCEFSVDRSPSRAGRWGRAKPLRVIAHSIHRKRPTTMNATPIVNGAMSQNNTPRVDGRSDMAR
jgi:hypothetical protein